MAQFSWREPQEEKCVLRVYKDILKQPGITYRQLLIDRTFESLGPSLELLEEDGLIRREITPGLDDIQDAQKFFHVPKF
jgi:hypothetical protein